MACDESSCSAYLGEVRLEGSEEALYIGTVFLSAGDFLASGGVVLYCRLAAEGTSTSTSTSEGAPTARCTMDEGRNSYAKMTTES